MTRITEIDRLSVLTEILSNRSGEQLAYASLASEIKVDEKTVKSWVVTLKHLFYGFEVRPWSKNIENSIRKMPKWFLRDWALVKDAGKRFETMVACHLLKATEGWTDLGLGEFDLFYVRDKQKHEVDFLVTRDRFPWFLVEAKCGQERLADNLLRFQKQLQVPLAFQVVQDLPFEKIDCFKQDRPVIVPALTFFSQLL